MIKDRGHWLDCPQTFNDVPIDMGIAAGIWQQLNA
jgi:hypothetical protein